jgi:hypothetical protein
MSNKISTTIKTIDKLLDKLENSSIGSIALFLIALSIGLVKPVVYYSTLFCSSNVIVNSLCIITIFLCIVFCCKKTQTDKTTTIIMLSISLVFCLTFNVESIEYENIFTKIYLEENTTKDLFVYSIHNKAYFAELYDYAYENLLLVLLCSFQFIHIISLLYYLGYSLWKLLCNIDNTNDIPLLINFELIIKICFVIVFTSPFFYTSYCNLWNNIF